MSVLKYFKNTPWSPPNKATGPKCYFFSSNSQRGPWKKKGACRPPRATGACRRSPLPYISPGRRPLCHLSIKIQKKREG